MKSLGRSKLLTLLLTTAALLAWCDAPAFAKGFIVDEDVPVMQKADPKESCIVAAVIFPGDIGKFMGASLAFGKSPLPMTTPGLNRAFAGDGFAFVDVPKGPFRISMITWSRFTGKVAGGGMVGPPINEVTAFGPDARIHAARPRCVGRREIRRRQRQNGDETKGGQGGFHRAAPVAPSRCTALPAAVSASRR